MTSAISRRILQLAVVVIVALLPVLTEAYLRDDFQETYCWTTNLDTNINDVPSVCTDNVNLEWIVPPKRRVDGHTNFGLKEENEERF